MITQAVGKADLLTLLYREPRSDRALTKEADSNRKTALSSRTTTEDFSHRIDGRGGELNQAVRTVEDMLKSAGLQVRLLVDERTDQVVVKVIKESGEVIRQFPPEEILELARYLSEEWASRSDKGVLLEERV
ncbi:MAG: flagellar protein FlaG [Nitrospira sp.]|nr:flagellar protein FlaG [Nitrospira sp.]